MYEDFIKMGREEAGRHSSGHLNLTLPIEDKQLTISNGAVTLAACSWDTQRKLWGHTECPGVEQRPAEWRLTAEMWAAPGVTFYS